MAEPLVKTISEPTRSKISKIGKSHHFLRFFKKSQSSFRNCTEATKSFRNKIYQSVFHDHENKSSCQASDPVDPDEIIDKAKRLG